MTNQKLIKLLQSTSLVSLKTAEEIANAFALKESGRNQFLFKAGKISNEYFFLETGFMRTFAYDTEGNDITTNFYSNNQFVFEVSSFFNRTIIQRK